MTRLGIEPQSRTGDELLFSYICCYRESLKWSERCKC